MQGFEWPLLELATHSNKLRIIMVVFVIKAIDKGTALRLATCEA